VLAAGATGLVYAAAIGSTDPIDVAIGVAAAAIVLYAIRNVVFNPDPPPAPPLLRRVVAFVPWVAVVWREIARGVFQVARFSVVRRNLPRAGIVAIPFDERSFEGVAVSALTATLSPGEVLVYVDQEKRVMYLHVLDASDPDAVRRTHREFYERYQRKVLP
jgi:multisubunit Na+/H+ antiporter MnhE subunit